MKRWCPRFGNAKRQGKRRLGGLAVEMAITLPVLFAFVLAAIEFGRMNVIRHTVDNAAYRAARRGIVPGATASEVETIARDVMDIVGATGVQVRVTPAVIDVDTPQIQVDVNVPFDQNGFLPAFFFRGQTITGMSTMRREDL